MATDFEAANSHYNHRLATSAKSFASIPSSGTARNHTRNIGIRASVAGTHIFTPRVAAEQDSTPRDVTVTMLVGETFGCDIATVKQAAGPYIVLYSE